MYPLPGSLSIPAQARTHTHSHSHTHILPPLPHHPHHPFYIQGWQEIKKHILIAKTNRINWIFFFLSKETNRNPTAIRFCNSHSVMSYKVFLLKDSIFLDQAFSFILHELNQNHKPPFTHPTFPNTTCISLKPAACQFLGNSGMCYHSNHILFFYRPYSFLVF